MKEHNKKKKIYKPKKNTIKRKKIENLDHWILLFNFETLYCYHQLAFKFVWKCSSSIVIIHNGEKHNPKKCFKSIFFFFFFNYMFFYWISIPIQLHLKPYVCASASFWTIFLLGDAHALMSTLKGNCWNSLK